MSKRKKPVYEEKKSSFAQKDRGTTDELEIIMMVLRENKYLFQRCMDKVKSYKEEYIRRTEGRASRSD